MTPVVILELPEAPAELRAQATDGCSAAMARGVCRVAEADPEPGACRAVIVWENPEYSAVRVEFAADGAVETKRVEFAESDGLGERWAAAGLVVASLVGGHACHEVEPIAPPAPPAPRPAVPPPLVTAMPTAPRISWGAWLVARFAAEPAHWGGELGAFVALPRAPWLFATSMGYSISNEGAAKLSWMSGSLGAGMSSLYWTRPWGLEFRCDGVVERAAATADLESGSNEADQWRYGGRLVGGVVLEMSHWGLVASGEARWLTPDVRVLLNGKTVSFEPKSSGAVSLGARMQF